MPLIEKNKAKNLKPGLGIKLVQKKPKNSKYLERPKILSPKLNEKYGEI